MNDDRDEHTLLVTRAEAEFPGWKDLHMGIARLVDAYGRINAVSILHFILHSALYDAEIDSALGNRRCSMTRDGKDGNVL